MAEPLFPPVQSVLPIRADLRVFPVRRIFCVARNYAEHAREMGDSGRDPPFFFMKPACAVLAVAAGETGEMVYPPLCQDLHHEIELVAAIGQGGRDIAPGDALAHVFGYAVGLDMTRRDVQAELKKLGRPWELAKSFDQSAPISAITPAAVCGHPRTGEISLEVNGKTRQRGDLKEMIWPVDELVSILSRWFALASGDLIFTGTPAGVGAVARGDRLLGAIANVGELSLTIR